MEIENATQSQKPSFFYARHMQPGTARYADETLLVDTDAMKSMIPTGPGVPIFIHHKSEVPIDEVKDTASGYIVDSFYNELDGWAWFKMMIIDDEARMAISNGWSVSNAYKPTAWDLGGTKNNVNYNRSIVSATFTHLALVPNPRYENARIFTPDQFRAYQDDLKQKLAELHNSAPETEVIPPSPKGKSMLNFFKTKREEVTNAAEATHVELDNGKVLAIEDAKELLNGRGKKNAKKNDDGEEAAKDATDGDMENELCEVDGEKVPMKDLMNSWRGMKANEKKNAEDAAAKKEADDKAADEKKNADEAQKAKDEEEKKNGMSFFDDLAKAPEIANSMDQVEIIETGMAQISRGASRYGSGK